MSNPLESVLFTPLSITQFQDLLRSEIKGYFDENPIIVNHSDDDLIFNIDEASAYIKLSIPSIYKLVNDRGLPVIRKGKKMLFSKKLLTAWLMEGRKKTLKEIQKEANRDA